MESKWDFLEMVTRPVSVKFGCLSRIYGVAILHLNLVEMDVNLVIQLRY